MAQAGSRRGLEKLPPVRALSLFPRLLSETAARRRRPFMNQERETTAVTRRPITMRKQVLWLALCAGLGLSACATSLRPQAPEAPVDASKACANWRWIGISRPGARCPDV